VSAKWADSVTTWADSDWAWDGSVYTAAVVVRTGHARSVPTIGTNRSIATSTGISTPQVD
jgi:hypothetical protein